MNEIEISKIINDYVRFLNGNKEIADEYFQAWNKIIDLIADEPEIAWTIIKKILKVDSSLEMIADLSAGPLETFLVRHGDKYIDRVEEEAKKDPNFAKLLGGVWKNAMSDEVWERIQKVCDKSWDK